LEELESGNSATLIFLLGMLLVFLTLAAQYESYVDPLIIMLTVPLAVLGALLAIFWRGLANDVYTQIGFLMLIGIASKNAILIVEFANQARAKGGSIVQSVITAARERLRPILMTALSTIIGAMPLVLAHGPGAAARQSLGTAIVGGMCVATILSLVIAPVLYIVIKTAVDRIQRRRHPSSPPRIAEGGDSPNGHGGIPTLSAPGASTANAAVGSHPQVPPSQP
jgi:HAE1 family hydrophobic/amphiphilic exporter-1